MRYVTSARDWLAALALTSLLAGCAPKESTERIQQDSPAAARPAADVASPATIPLTSASDEAKALYMKGRALSDQLRNQDAHELFKQAAAKDSTFAMAHYYLALTSPTPKEAFQHMNRAVALSSKASEGERLLILQLQAGASADRPKALEYAQDVVAKYPRDARAHLILGNAYGARQQNDQAIAEYKKAIELDPTLANVYNMLGYTYRAVNDDSSAEQAFKKYIELMPNDPNPHDSYAELLMKMGRFDESIEHYRKALSLDSTFGSSRTGIAADLMYQGKPDAAIEEAQKLYDAARDDGDRRNALFAQVAAFVDAGKTTQALQRMQQHYELAAKAGDTLAMAADAASVGDILLNAGRAAESQKRYDQSASLVGASSAAAPVKEDVQLAQHYNKARVALATNDLAAAKTHAAEYMKGAEAKQNDFRVRQAHLVLGLIAVQEKRFDDAITELGKADQQDPNVIYQTALAYQGKGDTTKTRELAGKAANANILPTLDYAFIRAKAKRMAA
jgi:tetratricopeptide (TPR) repeat protein